MFKDHRYYYYFTILNKQDKTIFEYTYQKGYQEYPTSFLNHICHSSLDSIQESLKTTSLMYLKVIDQFNEWFVSAFVTSTNTRLILLHQYRLDEGIRHFFKEVYNLYIKYIINPFSNIDDNIDSNEFEQKVESIGKKYLK